MATYQNHSRKSKSKMKTNDLYNLCFRNPVLFGKSKCSTGICLVTSLDSYSDEMLECDDTPLSMNAPIQSLDYNLSAVVVWRLKATRCQHTVQFADYDDFFRTGITMAYKN